MSATTTKISKAQAEQALAAIKEQFKRYLEPWESEGFTADNGKVYPPKTYPAPCPEPTLIEDWDGPGWVISWEEGPDDWAHRAACGGYSEEEHVLAAEAAKEMGFEPPKARQEEPVKFPAGVFAEPYYSFVLSLHVA